jgi:hypothetical protein
MGKPISLPDWQGLGDFEKSRDISMAAELRA